MRHVVNPPKTLTDAEVKTILDATVRADRDFRDHMILSLALGTGLRVSEIVGLDVGDIVNGKGVKGIWELRPEITKRNKGGTVRLPEKLRRKLARFINWKKLRRESVEPDAPLFCSRGGGRAGKRSGGRLSKGSAQRMFASWQERCGFDRRLNFHSLRHTFCTNLWRQTGDLRLVQIAARHSDPSTTTIYTHASDEDVLRAVQNLPC